MDDREGVRRVAAQDSRARRVMQPHAYPGFKPYRTEYGTIFYEIPMRETDVKKSCAAEIRECPSCRGNIRIGRFIHRFSTANIHAVEWQCLTCFDKYGKGITVKDHIRFCTVVEDRRCESCGGVGCEECSELRCEYLGCTTPFHQVEKHHYAPTEMFGDEANLWPVGCLCINHHRTWHKTINRHRNHLNSLV